MLQPRIPNTRSSLSHLTTSLSALCLRQPQPLSSIQQTRHASHATQGRANGPKDSAGRRLGLKKNNSEHVVPGNIIFKQRGTKWHAGENVGMGKDHTLYALVEGYVRYYRNPNLHPKRKYIGVALEREGKESILPTPANAPRRRRVGMVAVPMKAPSTQAAADLFLEEHITQGSTPNKKGQGVAKGLVPATDPPIMRGNGYRIANVQLARDAEKNQVYVRPYVRKDRWHAWRMRVQRKELKARRRTLGSGGKKKAGKGVKGGTMNPKLAKK